MLGFIFFLVTASINIKNILPPSKAGNGIRFKTAKLSEIRAVRLMI